jgi:hypothetical protein
MVRTPNGICSTQSFASTDQDWSNNPQMDRWTQIEDQTPKIESRSRL